MFGLLSLQPAALSSITDIPRLRLLGSGQVSDFDSEPTTEGKSSVTCISSWSPMQPTNGTAKTVAAKRRPTALDLEPCLWHPSPPTVSTGFCINRLIFSTPALTSSSHSVDTDSISTLEVELLHHQYDCKLTKGSTLYLPIPEVARHGCGGISHSRSQVIEMFSPKNTMSYLTSP